MSDFSCHFSDFFFFNLFLVTHTPGLARKYTPPPHPMPPLILTPTPSRPAVLQFFRLRPTLSQPRFIYWCHISSSKYPLKKEIKKKKKIIIITTLKCYLLLELMIRKKLLYKCYKTLRWGK